MNNNILAHAARHIARAASTALAALALIACAAACTDTDTLDPNDAEAPGTLSPETRITATATTAPANGTVTRADGAALTPQTALAEGEMTLDKLVGQTFFFLAPEMQHAYDPGTPGDDTDDVNYQFLAATATTVKDAAQQVTSLGFTFNLVDANAENGIGAPTDLRAKYLRTLNEVPDKAKNRAYLLCEEEAAYRYYAAANRAGKSNYSFALKNCMTKVSVTLRDKETGKAIANDPNNAITVELTDVTLKKRNDGSNFQSTTDGITWTKLNPFADLSDIINIRAIAQVGDDSGTLPLANVATRMQGETDSEGEPVTIPAGADAIWNVLAVPQLFGADAALSITLPAGADGNGKPLTFVAPLATIPMKKADGTAAGTLTEIKENEHVILSVTLDKAHNVAITATLTPWTIATAEWKDPSSTDDANYPSAKGRKL